MATYVQTSGDFDSLDPVDRYEANEELHSFLEREGRRLPNLHLRAHVKRLSTSLGSNPLLRCTLHLNSGHARFYVAEEGFGVEAAVKSAVLALRYQVDRHLEMRIDARDKAEGRLSFMAES